MVNSNGNELTWTQTDNPFDHTDGSEGWRKKLAWEKAGIIKDGSVVCLGDVDDEIEHLILQEEPAKILRRDIDFACISEKVQT